MPSGHKTQTSPLGCFLRCGCRRHLCLSIPFLMSESLAFPLLPFLSSTIWRRCHGGSGGGVSWSMFSSGPVQCLAKMQWTGQRAPIRAAYENRLGQHRWRLTEVETVVGTCEDVFKCWNWITHVCPILPHVGGGTTCIDNLCLEWRLCQIHPSIKSCLETSRLCLLFVFTSPIYP